MVATTPLKSSGDGKPTNGIRAQATGIVLRN